jgi:formate dehydrogenase iron-sulfur subunit
MIKVFVPLDSAALSMGADEVATAISERIGSQDVTVVRTGSRGMLWLEPLVEVETDAGRIGYANVSVDMVPELFASDFLSGAEHLSLIHI